MYKVAVNETKYGTMMYRHNDIAFVTELARGKIYEEGIIENLLGPFIKKANIIADVGAHCGSHSVIYSRLNPNCKIFSFEPQKKLFQILNMNIKNNDIKNVQCFNLALGNKTCESSMNAKCVDGPNTNCALNDEQVFNFGGLQIGIGGEPISIIKMDDFDFGGTVDFIKIDVEGFESFVVNGGERTITRDHPTIFFEHNEKIVTKEMDGSYENVQKNIVDFLLAQGYAVNAVLLNGANTGNYLATY
jgi:FkbM family methyltransferase